MVRLVPAERTANIHYLKINYAALRADHRLMKCSGSAWPVRRRHTIIYIHFNSNKNERSARDRPRESPIAMAQFTIACASRWRSEIFTRLQSHIGAEIGEVRSPESKMKERDFAEGRTSAPVRGKSSSKNPNRLLKLDSISRDKFGPAEANGCQPRLFSN